MKVVVGAAMLLLSATAAQAANGLYIEGNIGGSFPQEVDISGEGLTGEADLKNVLVYGGAVGYRLNELRVEANVSYRNPDIDSVTISGTTLDGAGDVGALTGMINAYYDANLGLPVRPFVGAGIGIARVNIDSDPSAVLRVDDDDTAFAWNLMAGVSYDVTNQVTVSAGYRYLHIGDLEFNASISGLGSGTLEAKGFASHEVLVGVRYNF
jgi:opacity protein-like surface antigen